MDYKQMYALWLEKATAMKDELEQMDEATREDAFYRELSFGTAGLRGIIGAGTNRMNLYTVGRTSQALSNYVNQIGGGSVAVSYDSRIKSDEFARIAAGVFAANGLKVYIYKELMPTPCLSYAVRQLGCVAGVMVTASHNPAAYNGYKVYGADGCQITEEAAAAITAMIDGVDPFADVKSVEFSAALEAGTAEYISDDIYTGFTQAVLNCSVLYGDEIDRNVSIVYSPLNGTGLKPVMRTLQEAGYKNITVVREQEQPDGNFPTCPYPNPEIREAMALGLTYCEACGADLLLATDPDCDRVGIAVRDGQDYRLMTGNEVGLLLLDYICSQKQKHRMLKEGSVVVKTIVTTDLIDKVAAYYGVRPISVLTGFKYIGEQITLLAEQGKADRYLLGFEESYGYLSGDHARDKDAVNGAFLICEMFAYYKTRGVSLIEKLNEIYGKFGYCLNKTYSFTFPGSAGFGKMQEIIASFRKGITDFAGNRIEKYVDYAQGVDGLPKSDVQKFYMDCGSIVIRPSGTEPKLKAYLTVTASDASAAEAAEQRLAEDVKKRIEQ